MEDGLNSASHSKLDSVSNRAIQSFKSLLRTLRRCYQLMPHSFFPKHSSRRLKNCTITFFYIDGGYGGRVGRVFVFVFNSVVHCTTQLPFTTISTSCVERCGPLTANHPFPVGTSDETSRRATSHGRADERRPSLRITDPGAHRFVLVRSGLMLRNVCLLVCLKGTMITGFCPKLSNVGT